MKSLCSKLFAVIVVVMLTGCSVKFHDLDLRSPSSRYEDKVNLVSVSNTVPKKLGAGRCSCFYIDVRDVTYDGDADRDILLQVEKSIKKIGYEVKRVGENEKIDEHDVRLRYVVDEFDSNNFTWLWPIVPTWGHITMTFILEDHDGKQIWENSYKGSGFTFNWFNGYTSVANTSLEKILNQLIADLSSSDFNKILKKQAA